MTTQRNEPQLLYLSIFLISLSFIILHFPLLEQEYIENYDVKFIKPKLEPQCDMDQILGNRAVLRLLELCISNTLFDNARVIPFIFSVLTFPLIAFLARAITNETSTALFAMIVLFSSRIFSFQSHTVTGDGTWSFFLLLTIYLFYRKPRLSPFAYITSALMKGVGLLLLPVMLLWINQSDVSRKKYLAISLLAVLGFAITTSFFTTHLIQPISIEEKIPPHIDSLYIFRDETLFFFVVFLPTIAGLGYFTYKRDKIARLLLIFITYFYALTILLPLVSDYSMYDYRMIPMISMTAIGFAHVLNNSVILILYNRQYALLALFLVFIPFMFLDCTTDIAGFKDPKPTISKHTADIFFPNGYTDSYESIKINACKT